MKTASFSVPNAILAIAAVLVAALAGGLPQPAAASGTPADFQRYCAETYPNSSFEQRWGRYGRELFCRQPGVTYGFTMQNISIDEACAGLTGLREWHEHGNIVHCDRDQADPSLMLGTWVITPYYITNRRECGPVEYRGRIEITGQIDAYRYTGVNRFTWDTGRMHPACTFPAATSGTVQVEITLYGGAVTIRYLNAGPNTFVDDHLVVRGQVISGRDAAGQYIVYTKI